MTSLKIHFLDHANGNDKDQGFSSKKDKEIMNVISEEIWVQKNVSRSQIPHTSKKKNQSLSDFNFAYSALVNFATDKWTVMLMKTPISM